MVGECCSILSLSKEMLFFLRHRLDMDLDQQTQQQQTQIEKEVINDEFVFVFYP